MPLLNSSWTNVRPTHHDVGQWYYVAHVVDNKATAVRFCQIRMDDASGKLYLAGECNSVGMLKQSYGTPLSMFDERLTYFAGPVPSYPPLKFQEKPPFDDPMEYHESFA